MIGELLTAWTIRLALICFAINLLGWANLLKWAIPGRTALWPPANSEGSEAPTDSSRFYLAIWSLGFLFLLMHVACAFHFYHHWSHEAALLDTGRQTRELMGWEFGEGIYFSYLFMLAWGIHAAMLWLLPSLMRKLPKTIHAIWIAFLFFIAFNGAAVFESGWTRYGTLATLTAITVSSIVAYRSAK